MYVPRHFAMDDAATLQAFVRAHDFATLVTTGSGGLVASHVPILLDDGEWPRVRLRGHLARANPQWRALDGGEVLAIFPGPHAYVSPAWYETAPAVPTWNYAAVHLYGQPRLVDERAALEAIVVAMIAKFEGTDMPPWRRATPADFWTKMLGGIVGFEIAVSRAEGKFKLGQNRPEADRRAPLQALAASPDPGARALARLSAPVLGMPLDMATTERSTTGG
jgi:transcriptional regulator